MYVCMFVFIHACVCVNFPFFITVSLVHIFILEEVKRYSSCSYYLRVEFFNGIAVERQS